MNHHWLRFDETSTSFDSDFEVNMVFFLRFTCVVNRNGFGCFYGNFRLAAGTFSFTSGTKRNRSELLVLFSGFRKFRV